MDVDELFVSNTLILSSSCKFRVYITLEGKLILGVGCLFVFSLSLCGTGEGFCLYFLRKYTKLYYYTAFYQDKMPRVILGKLVSLLFSL